MNRSILIMAGGTGGHIFPALAVADILRAQGWLVTWLGAPDSMEAELVPRHGYNMAWVRFSGVRGKGFMRLVRLPFNLLVALWQSAVAIFRHRPDVVLGMGGYITFPGGIVAALLRRPLVIHEQNSIAGLSNKVLARIARQVLSGFPDVLPKAIWCGNPVRGDIAALAEPQQRYAARSGRLNVLVVGGSLGAKAINEALPQALALLPEAVRPNVIHQAGKQHFDAVQQLYRQAGVQVGGMTRCAQATGAGMPPLHLLPQTAGCASNVSEVDIRPFLDDMAARYAEADLVICRAGALTIAELAAAGVASILIPFPFAVDDHQTHNAQFLSERGAAILLPQGEMSAEKLAQLLRQFADDVQGRQKLLVMAQQARSVAKTDAAQQVAQVCAELAEA
ncbi:MAG: UDP-N-acetylglucosamine--N-acetylmuramyl-(pentapeptide) pyrophosphoryl-undecaprenol N-acetylglucosamine transferase [Gallionellaceae bacterium]|nr:UDP-N-acetylglucosamine--N-acetylmuramyl-(pentapeptide) pyrophosphoryl-undecaprenol N-acetylglucosamine transferase [Gallionellaceae bacterium]